MSIQTNCDEIDPYFGVPWPDGLMTYDKGELRCALTPEEVDALARDAPEQAEPVSRLLLAQPASEKEDPI